MEVDKSPSVSVAVLTYGEYSELASTLKSIVAQDYPVAEIIVSDDGSGREFPSEVVDSYDGIVAFQQSAANVGTVAHMNSLASRLQGTYLKFIATGDALNSQDALTRLVRWAEKECTVVTTSQAMVCNRTLEKKLYPFPRKKQLARLGVTAPEQFTYLSAENCIGAAGTLFHKDFFARFGGFSEEYRLLEDWPAWLRETREGRRIGILPEVTCLYATGGISSQNADTFASEKLRQDMLRCYEKEILPYEEWLPQSVLKKVRYRYALLQGMPEGGLMREYPLLHLRTIVKRGIKQWLISG